MFKKILCPTDGSDHAYKALDLAIDMAKKYSADLVIMHVPHRSESIDNLRRFAEIEGLAPHVNEELNRLSAMDFRMPAITESALRDAGISERLLVELGENITSQAKTRVETGDPADRILECVDKENIDCVVMGSRGLNDIKGLFLGSVSHKVANRAPCTCIAVK